MTTIAIETIQTQEVIRYPLGMETSDRDADLGIRDAKARFSDLVNRVIYRDEIVWITKNKRRVAAVVPPKLAELAEKAGGIDALAELVDRQSAES